MKLRISLFISLLSVIVLAQSAPSYYNNIDFSKTGDALKNELTTLITNTHMHHTSYNELKTIYQTSDRDPDNANNILLIYGSEANGKHQRSRSYNGSWNREHVFPKSLGQPNLGTSGPGADAHHIRPSDMDLNSDRGSKKFDDGVGDKAYTTSRGGWYPGNEWKGDVARIMMYMYVRYQNRTKPLYATYGPATYSNDFPDILLKWNVEDPVSNFEKNRNNVVYSKQHNRNPFIDNPYLATVIWGGPMAENKWPNTIGGGGEGDSEAPTVPTNLSFISATDNSITFEWNASTDNVAVTGYEVYVDGTFHQTVNTTQITINGLSPSTTYAFTIKAVDSGGNKSALSQPLNATTADNGSGNDTSCGTEDFENLVSTGGNPPASSYTTRTWTNNGITWEATNARTDISIDGDSKAICIRKGHLKSTTIAGGIGSLSVKTQLQYSGTSGNYVLKINGVEKGLIPYSADEHTYTIQDINVEGNITIEIIDEETNNRVAFDDLSWTCYSSMGNQPYSIETAEISIYPNPITNNTFYIKGLEQGETIQVYNMQGQQVQTIKNAYANKAFHLNDLSQGMYLIKTKTKTLKVFVKSSK